MKELISNILNIPNIGVILGLFGLLAAFLFWILPRPSISRIVSYISNKRRETKELDIERLDQERIKRNHKMNTVSYKAKKLAILEKIYNKLDFLTLWGKKYPVTIIRAQPELVSNFSNLCELKNVTIQNIKPDRYQQKYLDSHKKVIFNPNMTGFSMRNIELDENGHLSKIYARACHYSQNAMTAHILEWELYDYIRFKVEKPASDLKYRTQYHGNLPPNDAIYETKTAFPLLSVQAIVVYKDYSDPTNIDWKIVFALRPENVAIAPGLWQFQPAGGFEVYGNENESKNIFTRKGFNLKAALLREYAEELFNQNDLRSINDSKDSKSLFNNYHIKKLNRLLSEKKAYIDFLGLVVDLGILRHEISFLILIDDQEFSETDILGSFESDSMHSMTPEQVKYTVKTDGIHCSSAGLLSLACENTRLVDCGLSARLT